MSLTPGFRPQMIVIRVGAGNKGRRLGLGELVCLRLAQRRKEFYFGYIEFHSLFIYSTNIYGASRQKSLLYFQEARRFSVGLFKDEREAGEKLRSVGRRAV